MYIPKESEVIINNDINKANNRDVPINSNVKFQFDNNNKFHNNDTYNVEPNQNNQGFFSYNTLEKNLVPILLVCISIIGVLIIIGLIMYGIKLMSYDSNKTRSKNSSSNSSSVKRINIRNNNRSQLTYRIKTSDPYTFGFKGYNRSNGSKNSTLNVTLNSKKTYDSNINNSHRKLHTNISNIVPEVYDVEDSTVTYFNNNIQNTSFQDYHILGGYGTTSRNYNDYIGLLPHNNNNNIFGSLPQNNTYRQDYDDIINIYNSMPNYYSSRIQLY